MRKSIFHEGWWLDALSPGQWREVQCVRGGQVAAYLRFAERREGYAAICGMPQVTRFLGPVITPPPGKPQTRIRSTCSIIIELLQQLASYDHVEITLGTEFNDLSPFLACGYDVRVHPTLLLNCNRPLDELWAGVRDKTKNVIRRAREQLTIREIDDVGQFVRFYESNLEGQQSYFDFSKVSAAFAAAHARQRCRILEAADKSAVHATVFFIWDDAYVYYFLSTRNRAIAHPGAVSLLLWTGIELAASQNLCFDFDGGLDDQTSYMFKVAFGGEPANRFDVVRTTPRYQVQRTISRISRKLIGRYSPL